MAIKNSHNIKKTNFFQLGLQLHVWRSKIILCYWRSARLWTLCWYWRARWVIQANDISGPEPSKSIQIISMTIRMGLYFFKKFCRLRSHSCIYPVIVQNFLTGLKKLLLNPVMNFNTVINCFCRNIKRLNSVKNFDYHITA